MRPRQATIDRTPHAHATAAAANRRRLVVVFGLTLAIFVVELAGGLVSNSLALLADAGHMLTDVAGIGLALLAIWFAGRPAHGGRTFGYLRLEILAAVVNAVLLFGVAAFILIEAWRRLSEPADIATGLMLGGRPGRSRRQRRRRSICSDGAQRESLNMRGAYLEVMGDLAGSAAVIVAAVVFASTGWSRPMPSRPSSIALLIIPRTWSLLREAVDVLLEATPKGIDLDGSGRTSSGAVASPMCTTCMPGRSPRA